MPRLGVLASARKLFLTNVVIVVVGKASGMAMMQLVHHGTKARGATALAVDDSDPASPCFFFDVPFDDLVVAHGGVDHAVRASVFGLKGLGNAHLPTLLAQAHTVLVVTDGADPAALAQATAVAHTLAGRLDEERRGEVHVARVTTTEEAHEALFAALHGVVTKASAAGELGAGRTVR